MGKYPTLFLYWELFPLEKLTARFFCIRYMRDFSHDLYADGEWIYVHIYADN
jgi:hypothetical protein